MDMGARAHKRPLPKPEPIPLQDADSAQPEYEPAERLSRRARDTEDAISSEPARSRSPLAREARTEPTLEVSPAEPTLEVSPAPDEATGESEPKRPRIDDVDCVMAVEWLSDVAFTFCPPDGYDGGEDTPAPYFGRTTVDISDALEDPDEEVFVAEHAPVDSSDDDSPAPTTEAKTSRKDRKAMDREIPWREILTRGEADCAKFVDALLKEVAQWEKFQPVEPITDPKEVERILSSPDTRRRCMPSRVCYRDKNCGIGELAAKARPVILGFRDPDLRHMKRNASVMRRVTLFSILQIAASSVFDPDGYWELGAGDAMSAFLQGDQEDRDQELYMLPPRDPIVEAAGAFPHKLYRIKGNVYGGANGPYLWRCHVRKTLIGRLGFKALKTDEMVFVKYVKVKGSREKLVCIIGFHVDDALMACSQKYDKNEIMTAFEWRPWRWISQGQVNMVGLELNLIKSGELAGSIKVTQTEYIKETPIKKLPPKLPGQPDELDRAGCTEFSSVSGCLQWVTGKTRADLSAGTSLLQSGSPTRADLRTMYQLLEYAHKTADVGVLVVPVDMENGIFVAFHDSSWANAEGLRTQVGYMLIFVDRAVLEAKRLGTILEHRSIRTPRVVRSSLAGEACAATTAIDACFFSAAVLSEIWHQINPSKDQPMFPMYAATDCKCLFDSVQQTTPSLTEKRTILDIIAIQEVIPPTHFRWVPTENMLADGLTKMDWKLVAKTTEFMQWPEFSLVKLPGDVRPAAKR